MVTDLQPTVVRIDASLQDVSPARGELSLEPLLEHVSEVRAIGAEPLVILSYTPRWLGAPNAFGRDPTRVAPADLDAWEQVVHDVVYTLATAPSPTLRFEAWNEPDIPIFWQDTPEAWTAMITRTARAIAQVEAETGIDLAFGGPATAFPDPVYLAAFLRPLRNPDLPLDFVSWHYYGNSPFLGPDGNEFAAVEPIYPFLGRRNPLASPAAYGIQIPLMREWTRGFLAGSGRILPRLTIDEWNLSPGGFDFRHDSHEGAAFASGVLIEMQQAGLDESAFFQVDDEAPPSGQANAYGGHGLVTYEGDRKPAWWSLWLWQRQANQQLAVDGAADSDGLWALAALDRRRVTVLLASFSASRPVDRTIEVELDGLPWQVGSATVRIIDAEHSRANRPETVDVDNGVARLYLPAQSVAFVELRTGLHESGVSISPSSRSMASTYSSTMERSTWLAGRTLSRDPTT